MSAANAAQDSASCSGRPRYDSFGAPCRMLNVAIRTRPTSDAPATSGISAVSTPWRRTVLRGRVIAAAAATNDPALRDDRNRSRRPARHTLRGPRHPAAMATSSGEFMRIDLAGRSRLAALAAAAGLVAGATTLLA